MKYKFVLLGTVAALSLGAASQTSARHNGWYVGVEAGANWIGDNDVIGSFGYSGEPEFEAEAISLVPFSSPSFDAGLDFDTGWAGFITAGYAFDNNWRIEAELGYRTNDFGVDPFFNGKLPSIVRTDALIDPYSTIGGDLTEYTAMINVIYDVPLTDKLTFSVGVGAGVDFANVEVAGFDDTDTNFAYQAIAGVSYEITKRLDLTLTYRYLHVDEPEFSGTVDYYGYPTPISAKLDDLEKHSVTIGLRYDLYEDEAPLPPAPPAPPPPPAAASQFIIYFGFNKCNITGEADKVLDEAAATAKATGSATVQIVGHTDTVGSASFNQKLSECRANAAKSNLVNKGVSASSISAAGRGESELLVKTDDNAKEPQNRRATIDVNQ
jgi:outer membrane protein OmpA-like peptidoglycan-associated protein